MDDISTGDRQQETHALIEQAALAAQGAGKLPRGFVAALFARAAAEDIAAYTPEELAALAIESYRLLHVRPRESARIGIGNPAVAGPKQAAGSVTVIEIANDDMPFLLDSVLGEIGAQGLAVRLVVHPIFSVERDPQGKLVQWKGDAPAKGAAHRESFIHIHVEQIEEARFAAIRAALDSLDRKSVV